MCSDHPKSACININGYVIDCCSDSHTAVCKYSAIVSLVGELQRLSERLDVQTNKLKQQVQVNDILKQRLVTFEEKQKNIGGQYLIVNNKKGVKEPELKKRHISDFSHVSNLNDDDDDCDEDVLFINSLFKN